MRRATFLVIVVVTTMSAAVAWIGMFAWFVVRHPRDASWSQFWTASTVVVGAAAFLAGVVVLSIHIRSSRTWSWRRRQSDGGPASKRVIELLSSIALAAGLSASTIIVVDDDVVNTTVSVRSSTVIVTLTSGACDLPTDQLAALIAFDLAIARSPALRRTQSVRASVDVVARMVKALWLLVPVSFALGALTGHALPWAAGMLIGVGGLIVTIPVGVLASGAAVTLAIAANTIADRDAVAMTFLPDVYLDVLLGVITDEHVTHTPLTPLVWFERTTIRDDVPALAASAQSRIELIHRAEQMSALARVPLPAQWPPQERGRSEHH